MSVNLKKLTIKGFKTIKELVDFKPRPINIFIGSNGAGKSNLISFFRFLSWMTGSSGHLQEHIAMSGGANSLLHDGAEATNQMSCEITLETEAGENDYKFRLFFAAGDTLVFADEQYRFSRDAASGKADWSELGAGHKESKLIDAQDNQTAQVVLRLLQECSVYQFHNTSSTSRMRIKWGVHDNKYLKEDGGNIASVLLRLKESERNYYTKIVETIRMCLPFFDDFVLEPQHGSVILQWLEKSSDMVFNASQASDGMLRFIALVTLLGQPVHDLPDVIILDEPELGLHPYAIEILAGMLKGVSRHTQVFLATQSTALVDHFDVEDIVVVDRHGRESSFTRLEPDKLKDWLEEYSISELWEKNVVGGRPF